MEIISGGSSTEGKRELLGKKKSKKGNKKIRTIILSALIIAFAGFAISLIRNNKPHYTISLVGLILFIVGGIAGIIVAIYRVDNETTIKISGVILVVAGVLYLIGTSWVIGTCNTILHVGTSNQDARC